MNTRNNFFITDEACCCCENCCKRQHFPPCWCKDFFCDDHQHQGCNCQKTNPWRPPTPCPPPKPPTPPTPPPIPEPICDCESIGIQAVMQNSEAPILEVGENLKLDTILHNVGDGITYDETTGEFTIKKAGNYKISWQIIVGGSDTTRFVNFGIKLNGEAYHDFPLPVTAGLLTSDLILTTEKPDEVIALYNNTEDRVRLSRHTPNANLVITMF